MDRVRWRMPGAGSLALVLLALVLVGASLAIVIGSLGLPVLPRSDRNDPPAPSGAMLPGAFTYQQQRRLSCEYASVAIATTMIGRPVSEYEIERVVPLAENPHDGYRGNIEGEWGNTDDYGVYNEALPHFGLRGEVVYGGRHELMRELGLGRPTVVWLAMRGDGGSFDEYTDGVRYQLTTWMHVMLAYGYDETGVYLTDPRHRRLPSIRPGDVRGDVGGHGRDGPERPRVRRHHHSWVIVLGQSPGHGSGRNHLHSGRSPSVQTHSWDTR